MFKFFLGFGNYDEHMNMFPTLAVYIKLPVSLLERVIEDKLQRRGSISIMIIDQSTNSKRDVVLQLLSNVPRSLFGTSDMTNGPY